MFTPTPAFQEDARKLQQALQEAVNRNRKLFSLRPDRPYPNQVANEMEQCIQTLASVIKKQDISVEQYEGLGAVYCKQYFNTHQRILLDLSSKDRLAKRLAQDVQQAEKGMSALGIKNPPPPPQQPVGHANSMAFFPDCTNPDVYRMRRFHAEQARRRRRGNVLAVRQPEDVKDRALRKTR